MEDAQRVHYCVKWFGLAESIVGALYYVPSTLEANSRIMGPSDACNVPKRFRMNLA